MTKQRQFASMEDLMPLIKESLEMGQQVRFSPRGKSMLPFLREGQDSVILTKPIDFLKPYDIALYQRNDGKYILHRIVSADEKGRYVCMGDNQLTKEFGINQNHIIAVVSGVCRGNHSVNLNGSFYKLYCRLWYHGRRGLRLLLRIKGKLWRK